MSISIPPDEMSRPYAKYEKNDENKLKYALHMQTYFGTTKNECLKFANHIYAALQAEVVRRCIQDGKTLPNGDPPATISDVLTILKTSEMVETFKTDKAEVYNCIFRWIKSVTFEENLSWVKDAIEDYFKENGMLVRLARGQTKTTRRHSLVRLAVEKGTQSTKEKFKEMEAKTFGWVLQMDKKVDRYSKSQGKLNTYLKRMASDQYDTVRLNPSIVPKSHQKYPVYWLEKVGTTGEDIEPDIGAMLDVIIDTVSLGDSITVDELVELFQEKIEKLGASTSARHPSSTDSISDDLLEDAAGRSKQKESDKSVLSKQEEPLNSMEDRMNNLFVSQYSCQKMDLKYVFANTHNLILCIVQSTSLSRTHKMQSDEQSTLPNTRIDFQTVTVPNNDSSSSNNEVPNEEEHQEEAIPDNTIKDSGSSIVPSTPAADKSDSMMPNAPPNPITPSHSTEESGSNDVSLICSTTYRFLYVYE